MMMQFLHFDSLQNIPGLSHAITTRGGVGGPYDSLNLAYHVGDDPARVTENRKRVANELGYDAASLVAAQQVHGANAQLVRETGQGAFGWKTAIPECDALIAEDADLPVLIQVADCAPVLIVDPSNHVLATIHAGWRGAVAGIVSETVLTMRAHRSFDATQLRAGIGPCLCIDCFEIGPEVVEAAQQIEVEVVVQRSDWNKPHLDLRLLIQRDLENIGVPRENIETMPHCPRCQNDLLFSHRGQNGKAGRFGLIAWWDE
jgi:YfiH family protein